MTKKHMTKQEFIILSAELSVHNDAVNQGRTQSLKNMLVDLDFNFKECTGYYSGVKEQSFLVIVKDEAEYECIHDIALVTFEQESILSRDFRGNAKLVFNDGTSKDLGRFVKGKSHEASTVIGGESWITV